jgi:hypothetical protein
MQPLFQMGNLLGAAELLHLVVGDNADFADWLIGLFFHMNQSQ